MPSEPTIICPNCKTEIRLTESLAAPLIEDTRRDFEKRLAVKDAEIAGREQSIRDREAAVAKAREMIDEQVTETLRTERAKIAADEAKKAKQALATDLDQKDQALAELQAVLAQRDAKLAEAQQAQVELIRKQRELDDAKRELELTVEKRVQGALDETRTRARKEAEEQLSLKVMEKEQTILSMQRQIEELKRKAEQGSQQLQGEVLELELEALLKSAFPLDAIEPVPKGEHGGDLIHGVMGPQGRAGTILWETKRTKNWVDGWLEKLRDDQRVAKAETAVLVSHALPKGVETFDLRDAIWVTHPRVALPLALVLRQYLVEVAAARQAIAGQQTKMGLVYDYLTGKGFRHRVEAIVEAFTTMHDDLERERRTITKQWAKREEQIRRVMEATVGMYGDLQGIAGKSLHEIEGLSLLELEAPDGDET